MSVGRKCLRKQTLSECMVACARRPTIKNPTKEIRENVL